MFSFHKPRVYRSTEGCCICRAKSSSSRFTDSRKYEDDSMKCFELKFPRQGEICNACVLLVKRYKRLPEGSTRRWGHVVDARIGPGIKSMTKFKKLKEDNLNKSSIPEKFSKIFKKKKPQDKNKAAKNTVKAPIWESQSSLPPTPESLDSDNEEIKYTFKSERRMSRLRVNRRKRRFPRKLSKVVDTASFIDETIWKPINSCCGLVYENIHLKTLLIDAQNFKLCTDHKNVFSDKSVVSNNAQHTVTSNATPVLKKHHLFFKRQLENFPSGDLAHNQKTELKNNSTPMGAPSAHANIRNQSIVSNISITKLQSQSTDSSAKQKSFLHKIKSDTGKIVKHSLDKLNALKLKHVEISEVKHLVKPIIRQGMDENKMSMANKKVLVVDGSSVATKFNDNSSDSGFDENLLDRKSASPSQEEQDKKFATRPVQTMFLSSGVQIQGQQQNLVLTGNEVAAKILQSRRQQYPIQSSSAHASVISGSGSSNSGTHPVRAILNKFTDGSTGHVSVTAPKLTNTYMLNHKPTTSAPSLNKQLILIKTKYNNNNKVSPQSQHTASNYHPQPPHPKPKSSA